MKNIKNKITNMYRNGFFHILLGGTLTKVIAFISSIIIVRFVSKTEYAHFSYAENLFSYIYLVSCLGLDLALIKFCIEDDVRKNNSYLRYSMKIGTVFNLIIVSVLLIGINIFPVAFEESKQFMYVLAIYPVFYFCSTILQSFLRARLKNKEYSFASIIQAISVLVISLASVKFIRAYSIALAKYIGAFFVIIYSIYTLKSEILRKQKITLSEEEKKTFLKYGLSLLVSSVFSLIMPINEAFLVNNIIKTESITANYRVASLIPSQLGFVSSSIIIFYFPYFARMKEKAKIWSESKKVGKFTLFIISVISIIGILVSPLIIKFIYGDQYNGIENLMRTLWLMYTVNAGIRVLPMNLLPAIGYTKFNVIMAVSSAIAHFILDYIFISLYGINGAVIAGFVIYFVSGLSYWLYLRRVTKNTIILD